MSWLATTSAFMSEARWIQGGMQVATAKYKSRTERKRDKLIGCHIVSLFVFLTLIHLGVVFDASQRGGQFTRQGLEHAQGRLP